VETNIPGIKVALNKAPYSRSLNFKIPIAIEGVITLKPDSPSDFRKIDMSVVRLNSWAGIAVTSDSETLLFCARKAALFGVVHHSASSYVFTNIFMKLSQVSGAHQLLERI
jgi:hypothetical protein